MTNKKSSKKLTQKQQEMLVHQRNAEKIISALLESACDEYVLMSIHQESLEPNVHRMDYLTSFLAYEEEDEIFQLSIEDSKDGVKSVNENAFTNLLATKLSSNGSRQNNLSVIYFEKIDGEDGSLGIPEEALSEQWLIADGTIIPDGDTVLWEFFEAVPGYDFNEDELFTSNFYITENFDALKTAMVFFDDILSNATDGQHALTITGTNEEGENEDFRVTFANKDQVIYTDEDSLNAMIHTLAYFMDVGGPIGLTLRSFIGKDPHDVFHMENSPEEVRAWSIQGTDVYSLSSDELIDAYCTDAETGKLLSPEPNLKYRDSWDSKTLA